MMASWGMRAFWLRMVEKTAAPMKVKSEADPVDPGAVGVAAGEGQEDGDGPAQGGDLGQGEVDEDHAALDHVHAQVGVDAGEDEAGHERRGQELQDGEIRVHQRAPVSLMAATSMSMSWSKSPM